MILLGALRKSIASFSSLYRLADREKEAFLFCAQLVSLIFTRWESYFWFFWMEGKEKIAEIIEQAFSVSTMLDDYLVWLLNLSYWQSLENSSCLNEQVNSCLWTKIGVVTILNRQVCPIWFRFIYKINLNNELIQMQMWYICKCKHLNRRKRT